MLGDSRLAVEFAHEMLLKGIYVIGFTFPVVAKGTPPDLMRLTDVASMILCCR